MHYMSNWWTEMGWETVNWERPIKGMCSKASQTIH